MSADLHRICWECYQGYFNGTAAAKCVDPDYPSHILDTPRRCHFCGEPTVTVMEMYRHPSSVLARDCTDIHAEENAGIFPVVEILEEIVEEPRDPMSVLFPKDGDIQPDHRTGRLMEWSDKMGWVALPGVRELTWKVRELETELEDANRTIAAKNLALILEQRKATRPYAVLGYMFSGMVVMGEKAQNEGVAMLRFTLPTGPVAFGVRLPDLDLLENIPKVDEWNDTYPTEDESAVALKRLPEMVKVSNITDEMGAVMAAFQNYALEGQS